MNIKNINTLILSSIFAIFIFAGCVATGSKFANFKAPSKDKSKLYVYRPSGIFEATISYDVHITNANENKVIGTLKHGGYIEQEVNAIKNTEIWARTEAKTSIFLDLKPNKIYCIKAGVGSGFLIGRPTMSVVNGTTCKKEIINTKASYD